MKVLIWNMTEAGEYASSQKEKDTSLKSLSTAYFNQALTLNKIDKVTFFKSFDYYQSKPDLNKILFDSVAAYANRQRTELYKRFQ